MNSILNLLKRIILQINSSNYINNKGKIENHQSVKNSTILGNINCPKIKKIENSTLNGSINMEENIEMVNSEISGNVIIGKNCRIKDTTIKVKKLYIGNFTSLWGPNIFINQLRNTIHIGNFCSIAKNVTIQEYNHNMKKASTFFIGQNVFNESWENEKISKDRITILNDVWIGEKTTILSGVSIGNGAIIGAGSIVTKDIPNYAIAVGVPAKIIGYRFSPEIIEKLENLKWWDWDQEKIIRNKVFFRNEITIDSFKNII